MKQSAFWTPLFALALIMLNACADPTTVGAELLEGDTTKLEFFDTISIEANIEMGTPLTTHSRFSSFASYLSGSMLDPVFGKSTSTIYFQVFPQFRDPFRLGTEIFIDSTILVLPYAVNGFYGNQAEFYDLDVLRLSEGIPNDNDYLSDLSFEAEPIPLASISYRPRFDSVTVVDYSSPGGDTLSLPMLRIPLNRIFGQEILFLDSAILASDAFFLDWLKGIKLETKSVNRGMTAFNLFTPRAGVFVYYRVDGTNYQFQLEVNSASTKYASFEHDYTGTIVEQALQNPSTADSLFYIQGMAGTIVKLKLPNLEELRNRNLVVNKAELEIRIGSLEGDSSSTFLPSEQILLAVKGSEGNLLPVDDFTLALSDLEGRFGGFLTDEPGDDPDAYRVNLSTHLQEMINGNAPNELYILVSPKAERAARSILYGPNHPEYPIKLKVTATALSN